MCEYGYGYFHITEKIIDVGPEGWKIYHAFHVSLQTFVSDAPNDMPLEKQPEVQESDEILVHKNPSCLI